MAFSAVGRSSPGAFDDVFIPWERVFYLRPSPAAETNPVASPSGLALPNPTTALAGRIFAIERYPHMLQIIRELCGSGLLMASGKAYMYYREIGPHLHRYVVGQDEGGPERFRLLKLAWEYACDSFGARQLLHEMYNVGSLATNKQRLASTYDTSPCVALARELAGLTEQAARFRSVS